MAGLALGFVARRWPVAWLGTGLEAVGSPFVQLLFLIVPVPVFTAIVASIANLRNLAVRDSTPRAYARSAAPSM